jgi:DNA-binding MarR family transcriptional regulator
MKNDEPHASGVHSHHRHEMASHFVDLVHRISPEANADSVLLFMQIMRANHKLTQAVDRHLGRSNLSWAKFRLLMDLGRGEHLSGAGMQPSELSELAGLSRNTVSALIASLEQEGLISRELHSTDRRRFVIRLTSEGKHVLHDRMADYFRFVTHCFGVLEPAERTNLLALMSKLADRMTEQVCVDRDPAGAPMDV